MCRWQTSTEQADMPDPVTKGSVDPIEFKLTLSGVGVDSLTFSAGDITLSKDDGAWTDITSAVSECVGSGLGKGWYKWTPASSTDTNFNQAKINIADLAGGEFDENGIVMYAIGPGGRFP